MSDGYIIKQCTTLGTFKTEEMNQLTHQKMDHSTQYAELNKTLPIMENTQTMTSKYFPKDLKNSLQI